MTVFRASGAAIAAAIVATLAAGTCVAAQDTACVDFAGAPAGARVSLEREHLLSGTLPVAICGIAPETPYRFQLEGAGLERRIGVFSLSRGGSPDVQGIRLSTIARNAIMPGWGSAEAERARSGAVDFLSLGVTAVVFWQEYVDYGHLESRFEALTAGAAGARTNAELARYQAAAHAASIALNVQNDHLRRLAYFGASIYGLQIVESFLADAPPGWSAGGKAASVTLSGTERSLPKALVLSILFPGRGQLYQGKKTRGMFLSAASVTAGLFALDYWNKYDQAAASYELGVEMYEAATGTAERAALARTCDRLWGDVENSESSRNVSFGVAAAIWGIGILDVFFGSVDEGAGAPLSFELDARGPAVAIRF